MTDTEIAPIPMEKLGFDARILAAAWFGMGLKATVTLHLAKSRPTARTRAAIDELLEHGVMSVAPYNDFGGEVYNPLMDCADAFEWMGRIIHDKENAAAAEAARWPLYEPIDEDGAYALMSPFGQGIWDKERRGKKPRDNPYDAITQEADHMQWKRGHRAGGR